MLTPLGSLTTVTSLPADQLAEYCYYRMFTFCVSLTNLPELPYFTSLATGCFKSMFQYCTKLSSVSLVIDNPEIAESFNPELYFFNWLNGAGKDVDSPQLYLGGAIGSYYTIFREYLTNDNCFPGNWTVRTD